MQDGLGWAGLDWAGLGSAWLDWAGSGWAVVGSARAALVREVQMQPFVFVAPRGGFVLRSFVSLILRPAYFGSKRNPWAFVGSLMEILLSVNFLNYFTVLSFRDQFCSFSINLSALGPIWQLSKQVNNFRQTGPKEFRCIPQDFASLLFTRCVYLKIQI